MQLKLQLIPTSHLLPMEILHIPMETSEVAQLICLLADMEIALLRMEILDLVVLTCTLIDLVILQAFTDLLEELQQI